MKRFISLSLVFALALVVGCSDDDGTQQNPDSAITKKDGGVRKDGQPGKDQSKPKPDQATPKKDMSKPKPDLAPSKLSCSQIGSCSDTCAGKCPGGLAKLTCMINCSNTCKAKGCTTGQTVYGKLYACINSKCMLDCMGGPTAGCKSCVTKKCSTEEKACAAQKC